MGLAIPQCAIAGLMIIVSQVFAWCPIHAMPFRQIVQMIMCLSAPRSGKRIGWRDLRGWGALAS